MSTVDRSSRPDLPCPVVHRPAGPTDADVLGRLWLLFRHDMSAVDGRLPAPDGSYRSDRLRAALDGAPGWRAWLALADGHPIGLCLVRDLDRPVRVLNSFFVVAPARRGGHGTGFATHVMRADPGSWTVAYQDRNRPAAAFWPSLARRLDPGWSVERRPVPHRPDLARDTWISLRVAPSGDAGGRAPC